MKQLYIFIALTLLTSPLLLNGQNIFNKFSVSQCDSLIKANDSNPNFVIVDVRTPGSWKPDHLYGSICRNYYDSDFEQQLEALPKHKMYLIHCQSGGRSGRAFTTMQELGFKEVYDMKGGMSAWKNASLPTTSVIEPQLMLVNYGKISEETVSGTDTIKITVTNRANDTLRFTSVALNDLHELTTNFDEGIKIAGAEDYTFYLYHSPGYIDSESTDVHMESNGGSLEFQIVYKNGVIQSVPENEIITEIRIFPNPASEYITAENINGQQPDQVRIYSITGRQVWQQTNLSGSPINISALPNGIYLVKVEIDRQQISKKLVINH